MQEQILPHFTMKDQAKFQDLEKPRRPTPMPESVHFEHEASPTLPKIASFFDYIRQRADREIESEAKDKALSRIEGLMREMDDAAHRYIAVRVRHVRLADEMVQDRETGRVSEGKKQQFEMTDRERKVAHETYMDSIVILGRNLRDLIAKSHEVELTEVAPIDEEFAELFDRSNREVIARHATNYCWYKLSESLGIPYVERSK